MFATAGARTWTSADGSSTFEGDLSSYDAETKVVEVIKEGVTVSFTADKLSEQDRAWLVDHAAGAATGGEDSATFTSKHLNGLKRLVDGEMVDDKIGEDVEFILLYYSASW